MDGDSMPAMPRPTNKARKIAYRILGMPAAFLDKKSERDREVDKIILRDYVQRQK